MSVESTIHFIRCLFAVALAYLPLSIWEISVPFLIYFLKANFLLHWILEILSNVFMVVVSNPEAEISLFFVAVFFPL